MKRLALLVAVSMVLLVLATPASGKAVPRTETQVAAGGPAITLSPEQGTPGTLVTVTGAGFDCHNGTAVAAITFDGTDVNGAGTAIQCDSTFSASFPVPAGAQPGPHTIVAEGMAPQSAPASPAAPTATETSVLTATPPVPTATSTPVLSSTPTPVPPTATPTSIPSPSPTATNTPLSPTSTPLPPTSTPVPPTSTSTPAIETVPAPGPTLTPVVLPTPPPTSTPTPLPTATPRPTPTPCTAAPCFLLQPSGSTSSHRPSRQIAGISYQLVVSRQAAAAPLGRLTADGDKASATFQVTEAATTTSPFTVTQSATCSTTPVVGVTTPCTITETVTNNTNHTLNFSHTVTNHLASNVRFVSATASAGSVAASGSDVVWSNFELAPHQSAQATVQVSFTPTASQVGSQIVLSDGITADAVDVTTGKSYAFSYGTVAIQGKVAAAKAQATAGPPAGGGGPAAAFPSRPSVSSSPSRQNQPGTTGLPVTGGGGTQVNLDYLAP